MEKLAMNAKGHYIICGLGSVALHIVNELAATRRPFVVVDVSRANVEKAMESYRDYGLIEGDATDNATLVKASVERAAGLFAVTPDDNLNIIICLTARQLNPGMRIVARCNETKNSDKMRKAGADAVVSPTAIGGMRMASEMVRPTVVSFLDIMLRDKQQNLRVEEVMVPAAFSGRPLAELGLGKYPGTMLLAVRNKENWVYNPAQDYVVRPENTLVLMTTPGDMEQLTRAFTCSQS